MAQTAHGFFGARRELGISEPELTAPGLREYPNVPRAIGAAVSLKMATLHELDTVYGVKDLYDLLEVAAIDGYNRRMIQKHIAKQEATA